MGRCALSACGIPDMKRAPTRAERICCHAFHRGHDEIEVAVLLLTAKQSIRLLEDGRDVRLSQR
jgi:hypothetical protein